MESPVDQPGRPRRQGIHALLSEQDRVAGGLGQLLDAGSHVDGATDEGELGLPPPPMVPAITTPVFIPTPIRSYPPTESLGDTAVNQPRSTNRGVGMLREVVGCAKDSRRSVAQ
jgi:hypothetical protein